VLGDEIDLTPNIKRFLHAVDGWYKSHLRHHLGYAASSINERSEIQQKLSDLQSRMIRFEKIIDLMKKNPVSIKDLRQYILKEFRKSESALKMLRAKIDTMDKKSKIQASSTHFYTINKKGQFIP